MADNKTNNPNVEILCLSTDDESEGSQQRRDKKITNNQKKRQRKYDKRISVKKKKRLKEEKYFAQHDEIINSNIPYGVEANSSPHIFINQWFHRIEKNSIVLRIIEEVQTNQQREIFL